MPDHADQTCPYRPAVEALAHDTLPQGDRPAQHRHLEHCEPCRTLFRQMTGGWFPRVENYTVVERLGEGGFGAVYKAIHHAKQRTEALKVLYRRTPLRAAYFENEVHLAAGLRHPNIATLYEAHLTTPPLYYAMEFVLGQQLGDYLRSHDASLAERLRIVRTVAAAIGYAHDQNVVHRDIKPQNILIDADGQPHVVDFGVSKKLGLAADGPDDPSVRNSPGGLVGTVGYIAPEQLAGEPLDARADIYALGALLFHCVTGERADLVQSTDPLAALLHQRQVTRADDLAAIIAHCVETDPAQRYQRAVDLVADLDNYLAGRPIAARVDQPPLYRALRVAGLVVRSYPYTVRFTLAACAAACLMLVLWHVRTSWYAPGSAEGQTMLVAFNADTLAALRDGRVGGDLAGLSTYNRKSWRLLHGRLMERLATAGPRVVVWDYCFPDAQPAFDGGFVGGVEALRRAGVPVVVGARTFDVNGALELCPTFRDVVHAVGAMYGTDPRDLGNDLAVPLAVRRGLTPPVATLAVAAFGAARRGDCDVDLRLTPTEAQLCYRKRQARPGEAVWVDQPDVIPIAITGSDAMARVLAADDQVVCARVKPADPRTWAGRVIPYHDVMTADPAQLRRWFSGRPVMVGQMLPGVDETRAATGELVHGCRLQAEALDSFLRGERVLRFSRGELTRRACLWCLLGALLTGLAPTIRGVRLRILALGAVITTAVGVGLALHAAKAGGVGPQVEAAIALAGLLTAGAPAYLAKLLRTRQLELAPGSTWATADTTLSATVLADSR